MGLLFENLLTGCTVTESECSTKETNFKSLVGGVDTIKACT